MEAVFLPVTLPGKESVR